jgi:hypothetical protein
MDGGVLWVWCFRSGDRIAQPVRDARDCLAELASAEFSGAPAEAIAAWLTRLGEGGGSPSA